MNQLLPAPCASGHICHRSWLGAELGSCPSRLFLSSMLLHMRALLQPGLQECSHCPTGWYISPRAAPTHFSSTPEATLPPAGLTMSAVAAATPGLCQLPSLNISSLFSTAATQPLTASGKGELTLQELILFLSLSPLQPLGEEETNNQEPVCRRPPQPYRLPCPSAQCQRTLTSPKENTRNKKPTGTCALTCHYSYKYKGTSFICSYSYKDVCTSLSQGW